MTEDERFAALFKDTEGADKDASDSSISVTNIEFVAECVVDDVDVDGVWDSFLLLLLVTMCMFGDDLMPIVITAFDWGITLIGIAKDDNNDE